jgi:hypothetical protein
VPWEILLPGGSVFVSRGEYRHTILRYHPFWKNIAFRFTAQSRVAVENDFALSFYGDVPQVWCPQAGNGRAPCAARSTGATAMTIVSSAFFRLPNTFVDKHQLKIPEPGFPRKLLCSASPASGRLLF